MKPAPPVRKVCNMSEFVEIILAVVVWVLLKLVAALMLALYAYYLQKQE